MYNRNAKPVTDVFLNTDHIAPADTVLPKDVRELVRVAGQHIPGGGIRPDFTDYTVGAFADDLDYMLAMMRHWSDKAIAAEDELDRLRRERDTVRAYFGVQS